MAVDISNRQVFTLQQVAISIQKTISERYKNIYWIKAEMNKLNLYSHSGHAYPELVEKKSGTVVAEMRSIIWKDDYQRINAEFKKILKEPLKDGINILICARITYDPKYGLTLRIIDIDPSFSLGELEKEKQENIRKLKEEGIFGHNKLLDLALLPKRLAIISVSTSKGYADFISMIDRNTNGFRFLHVLFPAVLQGEKAVVSILHQLKNIEKAISHFDAVAIIRGGGGDVGLSCYNNLELAQTIAKFPLPIFTGIGHSTNETVAEMVAHTNAITPTDLAGLLIQRFLDFQKPMLEAEKRIVEFSRQTIKEGKLALRNAVRQFRSDSKLLLQESSSELNAINQRLFRACKDCIDLSKTGYSNQLKIFNTVSQQRLVTQQLSLRSIVGNLKTGVTSGLASAGFMLKTQSVNLAHRSGQLFTTESSALKHLEEKIYLLSPTNVLKRGYSITRRNGQVITNAAELRPQDLLSTELAEGMVASIVTTSLEE